MPGTYSSNLRGVQTWVPTWGPSRADVGVARLPIGVGRRPCGGASPEFDSYKSPSLFRLFASREMAFPPRFRGNKALSDHDFAVSLAIPCIRNMLRERWCSMRHPWVITECPPVRERRRRCWYAAPFRRFARLGSMLGYMAMLERRFSCVGRSWPSCFSTT